MCVTYYLIMIVFMYVIMHFDSHRPSLKLLITCISDQPLPVNHDQLRAHNLLILQLQGDNNCYQYKIFNTFDFNIRFLISHFTLFGGLIVSIIVALMRIL